MKLDRIIIIIKTEKKKEKKRKRPDGEIHARKSIRGRYT
jgi:hypothetical protein